MCTYHYHGRCSLLDTIWNKSLTILGYNWRNIFHHPVFKDKLLFIYLSIGIIVCVIQWTWLQSKYMLYTLVLLLNFKGISKVFAIRNGYIDSFWDWRDKVKGIVWVYLIWKLWKWRLNYGIWVCILFANIFFLGIHCYIQNQVRALCNLSIYDVSYIFTTSSVDEI